MSETSNDLLRRFKAARRVATPYIAIETADQAATVARLLPVLNGVPVLQWDIIRGLRGNNVGRDLLEKWKVDGRNINSPTEFLNFLATGGPEGKGVPEKTVAFMLNAHRYFKDDAPDVSQAFANLRDPFKSNTRTLVPLAPSFTFPSELAQDVLVLDEPLPTPGELTTIVRNIYE